MKKKSATVSFPTPASNGNGAVDSNEAAKASAKNIALKPEMTAILDTLIRARDQSIAAARESEARLNAYAGQCATLCGVKDTDFDLNWDVKAFVPKNGNGKA